MLPDDATIAGVYAIEKTNDEIAVSPEVNTVNFLAYRSKLIKKYVQEFIENKELFRPELLERLKNKAHVNLIRFINKVRALCTSADYVKYTRMAHKEIYDGIYEN